MHIDFIARKVTLTDQVRQFTEKKLGKLEKYFNDILETRVELEQERHRFMADIFIKGKDFDLKSTSENKDLTTAIQDAVDKLEIQARRAKTRLKSHKRGAAEEAQEWPAEAAEPEPARVGTPQIVEESTIAIKPMTVDEAVLQLERSSDQFFVFRNATTDKVNVIYRRSDSNLGLITPEP